MKITKEVVKKVAEVARVELTQDELDEFTPQLQDILDSFSKIDEIDTTDTEMSIQPVVAKQSLREDTPGECLSVSEALENTEHKKDNYFKGPRSA